MESGSFLERPSIVHRNSAPASPCSSSAPRKALKKLFTRATWAASPGPAQTSRSGPSVPIIQPRPSLDSHSHFEFEYQQRPRSDWEDVRRRRADALASLGLLEQSVIYGEPYCDDDDDDDNKSEVEGEPEDDVLDICAQPEPEPELRSAFSDEDDDFEPEHGPLCLCCGVIGDREPPHTPGDDESIKSFFAGCESDDDDDASDEATAESEEAEAEPPFSPTSPLPANPKRQGRLFVQVRLELLPPSPISPASPPPSPASHHELRPGLAGATGAIATPLQRFSKPPRLPSLRISTESFGSSASTLWEREPSESVREAANVRLRKVASILVDLDRIEDYDTRKRTEMAFLS